MTQVKPYILVVEDEEPISILIQYNLEKAGFQVSCAFDGEEALEIIDKKTPDLIILDWMLPKISGIDLAKQLRAEEYTKSIPIIMVTARGQENDKLKGFECGADDYLTKPFSPKELIARIKALLRRSKPSLLEKQIEHKGISFDMANKSASYKNSNINLTSTEYKILLLLVENKGRVVEREKILNQCIKNPEDKDALRSVDVAITRIRKSLTKTSTKLEDLIETVRGHGYKISE
jgi:two-component system phosphate regulon response regulator PhoB